MKKKIPNFLANQRLVVSNFLDRNEGLIIGDTEKVLDIKNQYLIETYLFTIYRQIEKNKDFVIKYKALLTIVEIVKIDTSYLKKFYGFTKQKKYFRIDIER